MPDVEVAKQASWGATRDNLVLGGEANGIDGAHILSPMPYLMHTGKVTQNNVPVPMAILARLKPTARQSRSLRNMPTPASGSMLPSSRPPSRKRRPKARKSRSR